MSWQAYRKDTLLWQFISSWIERKIAESIPEGSTEDVQKDDEWGGAAVFGRSYTLLPMVSLFIGSILAALVTMTILSSMGVDIGPLLAGAWVIGLAIGFGAQKLVADIFPGFFYLPDDAVLKFNPIPRPWSAGWSPPPSWS